MAKIKLTRKCPMCSQDNYIRVDRGSYSSYIDGLGLVQELFPELNPMEREFIKSGYCPRCQAMLFGTDYSSKKIKQE